MPARDHWVDDRAGLLLNIWPDRTRSAYLHCPHEELTRAGLTEDDWWRAAQQADDEYVQTALALDWTALLSVATAHTLTGQGFSAISAATALNGAHDHLLGNWPLPPSPLDDDTFRPKGTGGRGIRTRPPRPLTQTRCEKRSWPWTAAT